MVVRVRISETGRVCPSEIESDSLGDAPLAACVLNLFASPQAPRPSGGCVDVRVPMVLSRATRGLPESLPPRRGAQEGSGHSLKASYDPMRHIVYSANWGGGLWRLVTQ